MGTSKNKLAVVGCVVLLDYLWYRSLPLSEVYWWSALRSGNSVVLESEFWVRAWLYLHLPISLFPDLFLSFSFHPTIVEGRWFLNAVEEFLFQTKKHLPLALCLAQTFTVAYVLVRYLELKWDRLSKPE